MSTEGFETFEFPNCYDPTHTRPDTGSYGGGQSLAVINFCKCKLGPNARVVAVWDTYLHPDNCGTFVYTDENCGGEWCGDCDVWAEFIVCAPN